MFGQKKPKGLSIIIVGCGRVGETLTSQLSSEGHDITIIDKNPDKVREISELYDVMGIVGNGASFGVQKDAGIDAASLIIAVTESDELNLLCCTVAKRVAGCSAIARVRNPEYSKEINYLRDKLGLAMIINPELEASREMVRILCLPTALEVDTFAHGQAEHIKFKIKPGTMLDGMSIATLGANTESILVCAVERAGEVHIPSGNFELKAGDIISFVAPRRVVKTFFKQIGAKTNQVKNTLIVGGGDSGYYLAKQLLNIGVNVKIIEKDKERCERLGVMLPKALIINGDGTDEELLREEGVEEYESFVPLTGSDEENILLTLYAKKVTGGKAKVITKINRITFGNVIEGLDLGSVLYPRYITSEAIIAYVRAKSASRSNNIETLSYMFDRRVEAIEFRIDTDYKKLTGIPLMNLNLKKEVLITFINRKGKIIIPTGQDCIYPGDTVLIVTTHMGFAEISDILD